MTDNVVEFPKSDKVIYVCNCGCQSFRLYPSAAVECANCGSPHAVPNAVGEWVKQLPELPPTITGTDGGTMSIKALGSVDFARAMVLRTLNDWAKAGKLGMIAGYHHDGTGKIWTDVTTQSQKDWVLRRLRELADHIEQTKVDE